MQHQAMKDVYKRKNGKNWVERKACHPRNLDFTPKYIYPYWFKAIQTVFRYEKQRGLKEIHKLISDDRIAKGLDLYRKGHVESSTVTRYKGGDVHAIVKSEDKKIEYTVIVKNYLPEKLPQYNYEREEYIANLSVDCTCQDHVMSGYRDNCSMLCKHICAVLWELIEKHDMPKIFISPEEKIVGYKKSDTIELKTEIRALPLILFTQYINILLLKKFRGMYPALGISIHKISNEDQRELGKPQWLTYTEPEDVEKLCLGIFEVYKEMLRGKGKNEKEIRKEMDRIVGRKHFWQR